MREAASRGFWVASRVPYGYNKLMVQDGAKKRPTLEPDPATAPVVKRIFGMAESGKGITDIARTLNDEGIANPTGRLWSKNGVHIILRNETYAGALVWGTKAKDKAEPVRVEKAFPAIVSKSQFRRVNKLMRSRAPKRVHPRRVGSSYLLSGLVKCKRCNRALSGQDSKSGKFSYYVCQSLMKRGSGACDAPRLNAKGFEALIVDQIRSNILTEGNIRDLVRLVDEEMDGVAKEQRQKLETIETELAEVRRRLDRLYTLVETTDMEMEDILPRIREHKERQERLEVSAEDARALLSERRVVLDDVKTITAYANDMSAFLRTRRAHRVAGLHRVLCQGDCRQPRQRRRPLLYPHARRQPHTWKGRRGACSTQPGTVYRQVWWSWGDSNPRLPPCKGGALPAELQPHAR